jgi:cytosine/adenosine deaminase-related metal-dependent hydrolase
MKTNENELETAVQDALEHFDQLQQIVAAMRRAWAQRDFCREQAILGAKRARKNGHTTATLMSVSHSR